MCFDCRKLRLGCYVSYFSLFLFRWWINVLKITFKRKRLDQCFHLANSSGFKFGTPIFTGNSLRNQYWNHSTKMEIETSKPVTNSSEFKIGTSINQPIAFRNITSKYKAFSFRQFLERLLRSRCQMQIKWGPSFSGALKYRRNKQQYGPAVGNTWRDMVTLSRGWISNFKSF